MKKKILIADDDQRIRIMLEKRLTSSGFEVISAVDGKDAVAKTRQTRPDLIIMDIMMPNMDGTEAGRMIRESEDTKAIPIIYITALKSQNDDPVEATFDQSVVLAKPFDSEELLERIRKLL